jgi:hypothetical protein
MEIKRNTDGDLIEIGDSVRVQRGHVRRREIATEALLSDDVTAAHYAVGRPDALGNIIALGQPFDFIDWRSGERVFTVYRKETVDDEIAGAPVTVERFLPKGVHGTEELALSQAVALAAE